MLNYRSYIVYNTNTVTKLQVLQILLLEPLLYVLSLASSTLNTCLDLDKLHMVGFWIPWWVTWLTCVLYIQLHQLRSSLYFASPPGPSDWVCFGNTAVLFSLEGHSFCSVVVCTFGIKLKKKKLFNMLHVLYIFCLSFSMTLWWILHRPFIPHMAWMVSIECFKKDKYIPIKTLIFFFGTGAD